MKLTRLRNQGLRPRLWARFSWRLGWFYLRLGRREWIWRWGYPDG